MEQNENKLRERLGFYLVTFYPLLILSIVIWSSLIPGIHGWPALLIFITPLAIAFIFLIPFGCNPNPFSHIVVLGVWIYSIISSSYYLYSEGIRDFGVSIAFAEEPVQEFLSGMWLLLWYAALVIVGIFCIKNLGRDLVNYFKQRSSSKPQ